MDQSGIPQQRRSQRERVLLQAVLIVGAKRHAVKLRNLSADGALVESADLPSEGADAFFERNDLRVRSTVVWVHGHYAGIRFGRPLKSEDVLRHVPPPRPSLRPEFKRPGLACRPLTTAERKMVERWMTAAPLPRPGD